MYVPFRFCVHLHTAVCISKVAPRPPRPPVPPASLGVAALGNLF